MPVSVNSLKFLFLILAGSTAVAASGATVIDFDDVAFTGGDPLANAAPATAYQGFDWGVNWVISPNDATGWYGGAVQPFSHSGNNFAWSSGGLAVDMAVHGGGTFDLASFWVRGWTNASFTVTASGYLNGSLVQTLDASVTDAYSQVLANFTHIDRLVLSSNPTTNLLLDDLVVSHVSPVPEPADAALFALGLGSLAWIRRRRAS